jgi:Uncharacterised nucleotidyltransferase
MPKPVAQSPSHKSLILLSRLLLPPRNGDASSPWMAVGLNSEITNISRDEFDDLLALANSNHAIVRGLEAFLRIMSEARNDTRAAWAETALAAERARIENAMTFLQAICAAFEADGFDVAVIKSLDHWPDLGSDLDLYTNANSEEISQLMRKRFQAQSAPRSWGDRLAHKWSYLIPGLPEEVEMHMGRLGQTGEQVAIASRLVERSRMVPIGRYAFRLPSAPDRLMISTLQRMYRHFYFRLCDIVDTASLADAGAIDYEELRRRANAGGIWEGVATYLAIVSDYLKPYRGLGLDLPRFVTASARFGGDQVYFARGFLRVPIMPQSVGLYGSQLTGLLRKREFENSARLGLLPWLAAAALVGQKITGSDKGVW